MIELALNKLQKYYGATKVLEDITFEVQTGEKVGIVGSNGCGKSTLLKIIIGSEGYESGNLSIKKGSTLGYLEQMPIYPDNFKVSDVLNLAFQNVDNVYKELEILEKQLSNVDEANMDRVLNKYSKVQIQYESLGGYEKEEKLSKVCTGLNINDSFKEKLFAQLSGREKTTIILGKILLQNPDILLLDEPSNHLDIDSREELEDFLKEFKGTLMFISHDRYFINNIASRVVELSEGSLTSYGGNYEYYKEKSAQIKNSTIAIDAKKDKIIKPQKEKTSKTTKGNNNEFKKLKLEKQIEEFEEQLKGIEQEISKFSSDYEKLNTLYNEKLEIQNNLNVFMEEYFEL